MSAVIYDPLAGQREVCAGHAVVREDGAVAEISGTDATQFLEALTSQHVAAMDAGDSVEALVLDPAGHVEAQLAIIKRADDFIVWIPSSRATDTFAWLTSMRFRMDVRVTIHDEWHAFGWAAETPETALVEQAAFATWHDPWPKVVTGGTQYGTWHAPWVWAVSIVDGEVPNGVAEAPIAAEDILRIAAGRPNLRTEWDERLLPHEVGWLRTAVHLDKGCYRGQETVAKVHNLGHPPRRLTLLDLDGSLGVVPPHGSSVEDSDGRRVGAVTIAGMHWEDGLVALALMKRTTPLDAPLTIPTDDGPVSAAQREIIPADAGGTVLDSVQALRRARRGRTND